MRKLTRMLTWVKACVFCRFTADTANGIYLHAMVKHPHEVSAAIEALETAVERIRDLHTPVAIDGEAWCQCEVPYPCPTIKALDGEQ